MLEFNPMNIDRLLKLANKKLSTGNSAGAREIYDWNRTNLPNHFEVYLKIPLDELRRRDPKNIYNQYDEGIIKNVAGLDLLVDEPLTADWQPEFQRDRTVSSLACELNSILEEKISISKKQG